MPLYICAVGQFSLFRFISARFVFTHILVQLFWFLFFVKWFAMMTTISDDSFSDDAHNVRKRSEINIDCMLCYSFCWYQFYYQRHFGGKYYCKETSGTFG